MTKKSLVTGGAGLIGSHLVELLVNEGHEVVVLDDFSSGSRLNLVGATNHGKVRVIEGDVRDGRMVSRAAEGCSYVFNLACLIPNIFGHAIASSDESPDVDMETTVKGTINVLKAARKNSAKVLLASSGAVYGEPVSNPVNENAKICPISPYGASKYSAEVYCETFGRAYNQEVVIARIFNTWGPRQKKYLMYDIIKRLEENPVSLVVYGNGEQVRDFSYASDTAKKLSFLMQNEQGVFNVGSGIGYKIKDVVRLICESIGAFPEINYAGKSWPGDIETLVADVSKLKAVMGVLPYTDMSAGLAELIDWYNQDKRKRTY